MDGLNMPTSVELLTYADFFALAILAIWILAHAIGLAVWYVRGDHRVWTKQAGQIAAALHGEEDGISQQRRQIAAARNEGDGVVCESSKKQISRLVSSGPRTGLRAWLKLQREPYDPLLVASLERAIGHPDLRCSPQTAIQEAVTAALRPTWRSIQVRMNAAAAVAPFLGVLGTMTGVQIFLLDLGPTAGDGQMPSYDGFSAALMTTAIGCILACAAVGTLAWAYAAITLSERKLTDATGRVLSVYRSCRRTPKPKATPASSR